MSNKVVEEMYAKMNSYGSVYTTRPVVGIVIVPSRWNKFKFWLTKPGRMFRAWVKEIVQESVKRVLLGYEDDIEELMNRCSALETRCSYLEETVEVLSDRKRKEV